MDNIQYKKARVQFDLLSLIRLFSFVGFCFGVVMIPITLIFGDKIDNFNEVAVYIIVVLPLISLIQGIFTAIVAYPLYKIITNKYDFLYEGRFSIGKKN